MNQNDLLSNKFELVPIEIFSSSGETSPGLLAIERWKGKKKLKRAIRLTSKILGVVLGTCFIALFIHPLIIPSLFSLVVSLILLPILFSYFMGQEATFEFADGKCPNCPYQGRLRRYFWITVSQEFTLLCPECGQSCRGRLITGQEQAAP